MVARRQKTLLGLVEQETIELCFRAQLPLDTIAFSIEARLKTRGGKVMRLLKLASLVLCAICFNVRGDAQSPDIAEKPVWTLEFIQVTPNGLALTLGYLD